jgi:hypothetical protein
MLLFRNMDAVDADATSGLGGYYLRLCPKQLFLLLLFHFRIFGHVNVPIQQTPETGHEKALLFCSDMALRLSVPVRLFVVREKSNGCFPAKEVYLPSSPRGDFAKNLIA